MFLRISDRYIIRSFLFSFLICFLTLVSFFMVMDSFGRLSNIVEAWRATETGAVYLPLMVLEMNAVRLPLIFYELMPVLTLATAMFTVVRLNRANEITPLLASGVSIYRILWPIFLMTIVLTVVQVADREFVIPRFGDSLYDWDNLRNETTRSVRRKAMMDDSFGNVIFAGRYITADKTQENPQITRYWQLSGLRVPMVIINALEARWVTSPRPGWLYKKGTVIQYDRAGNVITQTPIPDDGSLVPLVGISAKPGAFELITDATPERFETKQVDIFYRPTLYLIDYMREHGFRVDIALDVNRRIAAPLTNIVLLLIGLPFALKRDMKSPFLGIALAVAITGAYYAVGLICENFTLEGRLLTPLTGSWAPIIIFGPIGVLLFDTMES